MLKKDISTIEVLSPVEFNDDRTDILWGTADQSQCCLQIYTTVQELKEHLGFFVERTKQGDIISIWESVSELEDLIDEIAETNDNSRQPEKENDKIRSSSSEELAAELISFAEKEFPDQGYEKRVPIQRITDLFWRSKKIQKWGLPADIGLKIEKAEILAQKQLERERDVKEKEILSSLISPCVDWAKEHDLKKITEAHVDAFLLKTNIVALPRTKKRSLYALVNTKLAQEKTNF